MKIFFLLLGVFAFLSCEEESCPEGTIEFENFQTGSTECIDVGFSQKSVYKKDLIALKTKKAKFITKIDGSVVVN